MWPGRGWIRCGLPLGENMANMSTMSEDDVRDRTKATIESVGIDASEVDFRGALWDAGLAMVQFPEGKGGLGVAPGMQQVVETEIRTAGRNYHPLAVNTIGIGMGLPTVLTYGSEEHHVKHLRRIFTGEDIWCQMFSEPSHGSDVAGLSSRAVRDGDEWILNGQKVWTSVAHLSSYGMLLVRTDPDVPKHKGLSYFILDMKSPGVEIRPLYQITGDAEFNEVFFTDVRDSPVQPAGECRRRLAGGNHDADERTGCVGRKHRADVAPATLPCSPNCGTNAGTRAAGV